VSTSATNVREEWQRRFGISEPRKVICVGLNYHGHAAEQGVEAPAEPLLFGKFANAIVGPGDAIVLPAESTHVDAEAELAVVIGTRCRHVDAADALDVIAGYTVANDVSARDLQFRDGQWLRAKSFDTFCPLLPSLVPPSELGDGSGLRIVQRLNGETLQDSSTSDLIHNVPSLVAYASNVFTLEPGDVILTGTPEGVGIFRDPKIALAPGDEVVVEIERIGLLVSPVVGPQ
jgi:2-keto-4-pentenoate hydratase/2-oxohepta-3-ene-1,7-dioic acid hydratase in catechol pathway